jgi:predicted DNA-binding transcriptional regulator AlpA
MLRGLSRIALSSTSTRANKFMYFALVMKNILLSSVIDNGCHNVYALYQDNYILSTGKTAMNKKYYSLIETAKKLGISRQALYNRIGKGTAPKHEKLLGRFAFLASDVDKRIGK